MRRGRGWGVTDGRQEVVHFVQQGVIAVPIGDKVGVVLVLGTSHLDDLARQETSTDLKHIGQSARLVSRPPLAHPPQLPACQLLSLSRSFLHFGGFLLLPSLSHASHQLIT